VGGGAAAGEGGAGGAGRGGTGAGAVGEDAVKEYLGADAGFLGEGEGDLVVVDGGVGVVGGGDGDGLVGGVRRGGDGALVAEGDDTLLAPHAAADEQESHEGDAADEAPVGDALVAGDHWDDPGW
jgi:hypothetical protein